MVIKNARICTVFGDIFDEIEEHHPNYRPNNYQLHCVTLVLSTSEFTMKNERANRQLHPTKKRARVVHNWIKNIFPSLSVSFAGFYASQEGRMLSEWGVSYFLVVVVVGHYGLLFFWRLTAGQDNGGSVKDISTIQGSIAQHLGVGVEQPSRVVEFLGNFQGGPLFIWFWKKIWNNEFWVLPVAVCLLRNWDYVIATRYKDKEEK